MAGPHDLNYDTLTTAMSSQLSRRNSRNSSSRWSSRIEKPKSIQQSPRYLERRKTLGTKPYTTLEDHYMAMFGDSTGHDGVEAKATFRRVATRPVSWHPSSRPTGQDSVMFDDFPLPPSTTLSPESVEPPTISSNPSPYQEVSHSFESSPRPQSIPNMTYSPTGDLDAEPFVHIAPSWRSFEEEPLCSTNTLMPTMQYEQPIFNSTPWGHKTRDSRSPYISSTTVTSDFLPVQVPPKQSEPFAKESSCPVSRRGSNELIGLGLYDPPDTANSLLASGIQSTGKGLKLEETWQPPEQDSYEDELEAGESEQDADVESSEEEEELEDEPPNTLSVRPQESWLPAQQGYLATNMSGQSFFFDDDHEAMNNEWWPYKQSKQPAAQDAGMIRSWVS